MALVPQVHQRNEPARMYEYFSYAVFWGNGGGVYCVPTQGDAGEEEFKSFLGQPFILLNDNK